MRFASLLCLSGVLLVALSGCQQTSVPTAQAAAPAAKPDAPPAPAKAVPPPMPPKTAPAPDAAKKAPAAAPKFTVVKSWDFTKLKKEQAEWVFPEGTQFTNFGAFFHTSTFTPTAFLRKADLKAEEVTAVRVLLEVRTMKRGEQSQPIKLAKSPKLYWASPADAAKNAKWPFGEDRGAPLGLELNGPKDTYRGRVAGHKHWHGDIAQLYLSVPVPDAPDADTVFAVVVKRIELIKAA